MSTRTNEEKSGDTCDGVRAMVPRERMCESARKLRDTYARKPGIPLFRREFGYYCLERWYEQGLPRDADLDALFNYDPPGNHGLGGLGWCEAEFLPAFDVELVEDRGAHEVEQDAAGRHVLYFKGRRQGFMPEYIAHPVKDWKTWKGDVKWRLSPESPERYANADRVMAEAKDQAAEGMMISQHVIGGYMYLRSLIGPADLLYMVCEVPDLVHDCMKAWFELADAVIAKHQEHLTIDELFLAEDICYNNGCLISPDMVREFLLPYYRQLIANMKSRQIDKDRHLYFHVDTDGWATPVIPLYRELGMDVMSPFEVASRCDVIEIGNQFPGLAMFGGIDKRMLATTTDEIDRMVERILPTMRERGGFIPTCDHGVPEEVSLDNYKHYRKRCIELGG